MDTEDEAARLAEQTLSSTRERLAGLDARPTAEHVEVFDSLHQELSGVLGALGQGAQSS
ncbi:hypothetical protein [Nocardiopsis sp. YSL2]|uniref:hypothetical protein n=1 Tax=Nocardiopsis sp. YSL2 TaxID=2939492 RepID=UPI0026F467F7|nr:hypothetical protein [Nocardiopsis sp. YSL2]